MEQLSKIVLKEIIWSVVIQENMIHVQLKDASIFIHIYNIDLDTEARTCGWQSVVNLYMPSIELTGSDPTNNLLILFVWSKTKTWLKAYHPQIHAALCLTLIGHICYHSEEWAPRANFVTVTFWTIAFTQVHRFLHTSDHFKLWRTRCRVPCIRWQWCDRLHRWYHRTSHAHPVSAHSLPVFTSLFLMSIMFVLVFMLVLVLLFLLL